MDAPTGRIILWKSLSTELPEKSNSQQQDISRISNTNTSEQNLHWLFHNYNQGYENRIGHRIKTMRGLKFNDSTEVKQDNVLNIEII